MYRIVPDPETFDQVAALPLDALEGYAEVLSFLELTPWAGHPQHVDNPEGAVRYWLFGPDSAGQIVYLVLENVREVHVLRVLWIG
ncbi:hypothetical protein [Nocardia sp. NPDC057668]|uniref:hypothetical protein n=1 Tax=Nocardia sp. NPDC057668 TaxID=3346202 RepID=UPI00367032CB